MKESLSKGLYGWWVEVWVCPAESQPETRRFQRSKGRIFWRRKQVCKARLSQTGPVHPACAVAPVCAAAVTFPCAFEPCYDVLCVPHCRRQGRGTLD